MNGRIRLVDRAAAEWRSLAAGEQDSVRAAMVDIDENPIAGAPLLPPLRGYWTYRTAGLRILYRIAAEGRMVVILKLGRAPEETR